MILDPSVVVVIRDRTGKYVWNASKPYLPFNPKKESELEDKDADGIASVSNNNNTNNAKYTNLS